MQLPVGMKNDRRYQKDETLRKHGAEEDWSVED